MRDIIQIITKEIITTPYITSKEIGEMVERAYKEGFSDGCAESEKRTDKEYRLKDLYNKYIKDKESCIQKSEN